MAPKAPKPPRKVATSTMEEVDHPLVQAVHSTENEQEFRAVGMARVPGTNKYCSYEVIFKQDAILEVVFSTPDQRSFVINNAKVAFMNNVLKVL